jgi:hypothetical protein
MLTVWPCFIRDLSHSDGVVWIRLLHLRVQIPVHVGRTVVALKVASLVSKTASHVDGL